MLCRNCGSKDLVETKDSETYECLRCKSLTKKIKVVKEPLSDNLTTDFNYSESLKSVILLKTKQSVGVGFIIRSDGYVLTNAHVLSGAETCSGYLNDSSNELTLEVVSRGNELNIDLCLLKIKDKNHYQKLSFSNKEPLVGDDIYTIGNPRGLGLSLCKGTISRIKDDNYLQLDLTVNPGNSGGPVINANGEVKGVISYSIKKANGLAFAVSNKAITNFLKTSLKEGRI